MCDTQAYVAASQGTQCKECQRKQDQAVETVMVMFDPWPPCLQPFTRSLWVDQEKEEKRCPFSIEEKDRAVKSSKSIAEKLADYDEI